MPEKTAEEIRKEELAHKEAKEKRDEHEDHEHKEGPCDPVGGAIKHAVDATVDFVGKAYNTSTTFVVEKAMPAVVDGYKAAEHAVSEGAHKVAEAAKEAADHVPGVHHKTEEEKKKDEEAHREAEEKRVAEEKEKEKEKE